MIIEPKLPAHSKARIWMGELPPIRYVAERVSCEHFRTSVPSPMQARAAAVELLQVNSPISHYGLLGATHHPIASADRELTAFVHASAPTGPVFAETLATQRYEDVRVGLPNEYVQAVIHGVGEAYHKTGGLAAGRLVFDCAAHGAVGSSPAFFQRLSRAVCKILNAAEGQFSQEDLPRLLEIP